MKCKAFRKQYLGWDKMDVDVLMKCMEHITDCEECRDHMKRVDLELQGVDIGKYPCVHAAYYANYECDQHENLLECPDVLLYFKGERYALPIRDGGPSFSPIKYCPWCAAKLQ